VLPSVAKIWKPLFSHLIFELTEQLAGATELLLQVQMDPAVIRKQLPGALGKAYWPISF